MNVSTGIMMNKVAILFCIFFNFIFIPCCEGITYGEIDIIIPYNSIIIVDQSGGGDYLNIQDALDNADNGTTIILKNGLYQGSFYLNKSVEIIGESKTGVILIPIKGGTSIYFHINTNATSVRNLTIKGNEKSVAISIKDKKSNFNLRDIIGINLSISSDECSNISISNLFCQGGRIWFPPHAEREMKNIHIQNSSFSNSSFYFGWTINNLTVGSCSFDKPRLFDVSLGEGDTLRNSLISNNFIKSTLGVSGGSIENCSFINCTNGIAFNDAGISGNSKIKNNKFTNVTDGLHFNEVNNMHEIINNTFISTENAINLRWNNRVLIKDNKFYESGIIIDSKCNYFDNLEIVNNFNNDTPILFLEGNGHSIKDYGANQIILNNCNNFEIQNIDFQTNINYPSIQLVNCDQGKVSYCHFNGEDTSITLFKSTYTQIFNNTITGENDGIEMYGSSNNQIYQNWIEPSNTSCYDNSNNQWDNGVKGNYWKAFYLPDDNNDGISEISVRIPGGNSQDRFPLVPGVILEVDPLVEFGTTGDVAPIRITQQNLNYDIIEDTYLFWGNDISGYRSTPLNNSKDVQTVFIDIPQNNTETLVLWVNCSDIFNDYHRSSDVFLEVVDNDPPTIMVTNHTENIKLNDLFYLNASVHDNIGIENVSGRITRPDSIVEEIDLQSENTQYQLVYSINYSLMGNYSFSIVAEDINGNNMTSDPINITIGDLLPPLITDYTTRTSNTGDELFFICTIQDDSGPVNIVVEYKQIEYSGMITLKENDLTDATLRNYIEAHDLEALFDIGTLVYVGHYIIPVDDISLVEYHFIAEDNMGNSIETEISSIQIIDNIIPTITVSDHVSNINTGDILSMDIVVNDNIDVDEKWIEVWIEGNRFDYQRNLDDYRFVVPINISGSLKFMVFSSDTSGNWNNYTSDIIKVIDSIFPEVTVSAPLVGQKGKELKLEITATDNIGIASISWKISYLEGQGKYVNFTAQKSGEYVLEVEVKDLEGNSVNRNWTIVIEKSEGNGNTFPNLLIIVIAVIVILIIVSLLYLFVIKEKIFGKKEIIEGTSEEIPEIQELDYSQPEE